MLKFTPEDEVKEKGLILSPAVLETKIGRAHV
jgi:hypothetical protein